MKILIAAGALALALTGCSGNAIKGPRWKGVRQLAIRNSYGSAIIQGTVKDDSMVFNTFSDILTWTDGDGKAHRYDGDLGQIGVELSE